MVQAFTNTNITKSYLPLKLHIYSDIGIDKEEEGDVVVKKRINNLSIVYFG